MDDLDKLSYKSKVKKRCGGWVEGEGRRRRSARQEETDRAHRNKRSMKLKPPTLLALYLCLPSPACYGFSSIPLWADLQSSLDRPLPKVYVDEIPSSDVNLDGSAELPILYRDKECVCASSQTVWLAMECKNIDYITVLVSKEDDQRVPRVVWPDCDDDVATNSEHAIEILEQIQARYPDKDPPFYPKLSAAVDASRCNIMRLPGVMPRNSDPKLMDLAPYLFREDGTKVLKSSHTVSLEEIEEMQEEYYLGSYLCGKDVTAADMGETKVLSSNLQHFAHALFGLQQSLGSLLRTVCNSIANGNAQPSVMQSAFEIVRGSKLVV